MIFLRLFLTVSVVSTIALAKAEAASECSKALSDRLWIAIEKSQRAEQVLQSWEAAFENASFNFAMSTLKVFLMNEKGLTGTIEQQYFIDEVTRISGLELSTADTYISRYLGKGLLKRSKVLDKDGRLTRKEISLTPKGIETYSDLATSIYW